jgi:hypothetical protein
LLTVTFAFVVATALLFLFASTRPLGVVAAFVGLCISPLLFGGLLLAAALGYYLVAAERRASKATTVVTRQRGGALVALLLLLVLGGVALVLFSEPPPEHYYDRTPSIVRSSPSEEVVVLRVPEGLLQVSEIRATEVIDTRFTHSLFGVPVGETVPRIRVPTTYTYCIELKKELRVVRQDGVFTVVAPPVVPNLPAIDTAGIEEDVAGSWVLLPIVGDGDLGDLRRAVTGKLELKARSRDYVERQREQARATVREFVRTWLVEQSRFRDAEFGDVQVLFADEPARSIGSLGG